ncbi:MAG: ornithine carbamoyltransferase, partial [Candidatus Hadarchaeum sp.]|nr:ornithine carbamoyltransferase [Candidatus Hadarchaeum sp.]
MAIPSYVGSFKGKDFLNTQDFTQDELKQILDAADDLRKNFRARKPTEFLPGRTLFMIFYNRSLRTRN